MALKRATFLFVFTASVLSLQNKYCQLPCDYFVTSISHTVCDRAIEKCGPDPSCGADFKIIGFTDKQRQYIVDLHNYLRNYVAMGRESRGGQPTAANMKMMSYNHELEFIAQCWANTCRGGPLIHDHCRRTVDFEHVGQNLGSINTTAPSINVYSTIKQLMMLWYNEVAIFKSEWVNETQDRGGEVKVGHYTQMLWADTTDIGCAASYYTTNSSSTKFNHVFFVCNYGSGGNYLGLPVYRVGVPGSNCEEGWEQDKHYQGLCKGKDKSKISKVLGI